MMSDIASQFKALQDAAPRMRQTTAKERADRLRSVWNALLERKEDIFKSGYEERRTNDVDVAAELVMIKGELDFTIKNIEKWMRPVRVKNSLATMGKRCEINYQSKGVVLNISAYNAPTAECIVPMIPAIAAGNTIAIKPSELAPVSAQVMQEVINKALPNDEAQVIQGGVEVSQELLKLPFNHIYYTGGMTVGKIVMKAAADHFASITLEMGGKSPVIIDETANLENAATKLAWGRVMNAGQVCIAPEYIVIHESVKDKFLSLIKEKIEALYNSDGTGLQKSSYVPRVINERHYERIKGLMDDAISKGAELVFGGGSDRTDRYIEPTILTNMTEDMEIMNEEVFGPVLSVLSYSERSEVLEIIAKRPTPLAFYVYSTNKDNINYFLQNSTSGSAVVNNNCIQSGTNPNLPFGGVGTSGMGRIGGYEGFKHMSNARSVVHQPLDKFRDFLVQLPPYSKRYSDLIMKGLK